MAVQVQLLGKALASVAGETIAFAPTKSFQALAYLACKNDWVSRDEIGFLFWPDSEPSRARHNVRQLLKRLRRRSWLEGLETERHRLRWRVDADVERFRRAIVEERWDDAVSVYGGDFLSDLDRDLPAEYASWLEIERATLRDRWREAVLRRSDQLQDQSRYDRAGNLLNALLTHDPLDEEALRRYMELSTRAGRRDRALTAYRTFVDQLRSELDLEPTSVTQQLAATIRDAVPEALSSQVRAEAGAVPPGPRSSRPQVPASSFIGRDSELSEITHLLARPDCRVLTLLGSGGVGKSRIAMETAERLAPRYRDGVHLVQLEAIPAPADIPGAIATRLDLTLQGRDPPLQEVARAVAQSHLLLVLDNFEHLTDGAPLVGQLIETCPDLDVLTTSRERLRLEREWLLPVEGLRFPDPFVSRENALRYDAVRLFVERARKVDPAFTLDDQRWDGVRDVCRLVEGSPLAIELAAAWVRAMPVDAIARAIETDPDFLESSNRDAPDRHRGLRTVFEHSWTLLTVREQAALAKLAVFRGGFRLAAADLVASASATLLGALSDKSLVRVTPQGRYHLHPLIRQFAREKLAQDRAQEERTRARHGRYVHALVRHAAAQLDTPHSTLAFAAVDEELENIRAAWRWTLETGDAHSLRASSETIGRYFDYRALFLEGLDWFLAVPPALDPNDPARRAAVGWARTYQALFLTRLDRYQDALVAAREAVELLRSSDDDKGLVEAYLTLGYTCRWTTGKASERAAYLKALPIARSLDRPTVLIRVLNSLGMSPGVRDGEEDEDLERSKAYLFEGLGMSRTLENPDATMILLHNLGNVYWGLGDYDEARRHLEGSLALARERDRPMLVVETTKDLAFLHCDLGNLDRAQQLRNEARNLVERYPSKQARLELALLTGELLLERSDLSGAGAELQDALRLAWSTDNLSYVIEALRLRARIAMAEGRAADALRQMAFVMANLELDYFFLGRIRNRQLWNTYATRFPAEVVRDAEAWAEGIDLADVVRAALAGDARVAAEPG